MSGTKRPGDGFAMRRIPASGLLLSGLMVALAVALLVSLGQWQVRRLAWKQDLIAAVESRPKLPPISVASAEEWRSIDPEAQSYRRARLSGRFLDDHTVRVFTALSRPRGHFGGPGVWILTPLRLDDGSVVYVNRGFVPQVRAGERFDAPRALIALEGLIRPMEPGNSFTPEANAEAHIAYRRDPELFAVMTGLSGPIAPFFVDLPAEATPPSGLPQAGETRMRFPNSHLQYAVTWYGLAAALLAVYGLVLWKRPRAAAA